MTLPLRPNVCMLVFNKNSDLFLGERLGEPGVWQFPQGGVDENTSIEQSVLRELHEELGANEDLFRIIKRLDATHTYDFEQTPAHYRDKYRGQSQTFWLVEYSGTDSDVQLDRHHAEFSAFRWCKSSEIPLVAEPKRIPGYRKALQEFEQFLKSHAS